MILDCSMTVEGRDRRLVFLNKWRDFPNEIRQRNRTSRLGGGDRDSAVKWRRLVELQLLSDIRRFVLGYIRGLLRRWQILAEIVIQQRWNTLRGTVDGYELEHLFFKIKIKEYDDGELNFLVRASYRRRVRRERFEWPLGDCIPGSPWTGGSLRFGNRLRRTFGCGSTRRLSA